MKRPRPSRNRTDAPAPATRAGAAWHWLILLPVGLAAYSNSFKGIFLFDDLLHIVGDEQIRKIRPLSDCLAGSTRPVVDLSLAVNYAIGELRPAGYHAVNLAVHLLAGLTLFGIVRRTLLLERFRQKHAAAAPWLALAAAMLWVVHPLQTQSVTYVIQRAESMMGLFYLLTLYCVLRGACSGRRVLWYAAGVIACGLGVLCKPVILTAPLLILVYDRLLLSPSWRRLVAARGWVYAALLATWLLPVNREVIGGVLDPASTDSPTVGLSVHGVNPLQYCLSQAGVILHYLHLCLWPNPLCLDYEWPPVAHLGQAWPAMLCIALLLLLAAWALGRGRWPGFAGAWFFIILAPTSSFIPIKDLAVEHRMYLPLAAVTVLAVASAHLAIDLLTRRQFLSRLAGRAATAALLFLATTLLGVRTYLRNRDYQDAQRMWSGVVDVSPHNARARTYLAGALSDAGELAGAIEQYREALRISPDRPEIENNLANALTRSGRVEEAVAILEKAVAAWPQAPHTHLNLALAYQKLGRNEEALPHYRIGLEAQPFLVEPRQNMAVALLAIGRLAEAEEACRTALKYRPDSAEGRYLLGGALERQGKLDEARHWYRAALEADPKHDGARQRLKILGG